MIKKEFATRYLINCTNQFPFPKLLKKKISYLFNIFGIYRVFVLCNSSDIDICVFCDLKKQCCCMCAMAMEVFDASFVRQEGLSCDSCAVGGYEGLAHVNACIQNSNFYAFSCFALLWKKRENIFPKTLKPIVRMISTVGH